MTREEPAHIYLVTWVSRHDIEVAMKTDDLDRAFEMARRNGGSVTVLPKEDDDDQSKKG